MPNSASAVSQAIGVVKLAGAKNKVKVFEYPPLKNQNEDYW